MGCVSSIPHETNHKNTPNARRMIYNPTKKHWRQLEYQRTRNETINNPYPIDQKIQVLEHVSNQWVIATIIDKHNNWIRVLSQSPTLQFTTKLHIISDKSRIKPVNHKRNTMDHQLAAHGMKLISNIIYNDADTSHDTIYKSFAYVLCLTIFELHQNVARHIKHDINETYFRSLISNWNECKHDHTLFSERDQILILSHFSRMDVIVSEFNVSHDLITCFEHKYNENSTNNRCVRLLFNSTQNKYKLISLSMETIIGYIDEGNASLNQWNTEKILQWLDWIECGRFSVDKYESFRNNIANLEVNGSNIHKMNELTLKSAAIYNEMDVKRITENIERLMYCKHCNITDEIEEEETAGGILTTDAGVEIPDEFVDPIHYLIMRDPVISAVSGHSFERESITQWINANHSDPINQKELHLNQLIPNRTLREAIDRFCQTYHVSQ